MSIDRRTLLLAAAGALSAPSLWAAAPYSLRVLRSMSDRQTSLSELASGQALAVVVMKGHYCAVCRAQLQRLGKHLELLGKLQARVVGLNADSYKANAEVARISAIPFEIASDPEHHVIEALGLWLDEPGHPMPAIVVFDACGVERGRIVGRTPGDRPERSLFELLAQLRDEGDCDQAKA